MPKNLYKFRPINNYTISQFKYDELYVSKIITFNDDNELVYYNDKAKFKKHLTKYIKKIGLNNINHALNQNFTLEQMLNYLYTDANNNYLSLPLNLYATCFSKKINCGSMWAHYASNNTGFALAYDFKDLLEKSKFSKFSNNVILPVQYKSKRFNITKGSIESSKDRINMYLDLEKFIKNAEKEIEKNKKKPISKKKLRSNFMYYCRKAKNWSYENEWRIITISSQYDDPEDYKLCFNVKPVAIYFSANINEQDEKMLYEIAKEKGIPTFKMEKTMREKKIIYSIRSLEN